MQDDERPTTAMRPIHVSGRQDAAPSDELGPGSQIGEYVVDAEIGKGGMGVVYSATHRVIGKRAAIKVLKREVSSSPIIVERFIQEARAVNQIGHPNIIDIYAFGTLDDGRAYHVMDLLIGESLRKRLKRGPLAPGEAAAVIEGTASALAAAHDKGFVHRDLKPDNIYLVAREDAWPEVKLLDFGLAKLMPEAGTSPFQTRAGVRIGTPQYMAPEQARGQPVDYRTDIFALGVMIFEILSGRRPFATDGDPLRALAARGDELPPSLAAARPAALGTLPVEMYQLVDAMLATDPAGRPSLAAVRTVIKRLRSTGMRATSAPPGPVVDEPSAARLGATPLAPDDPSFAPLDAGASRPSQPPVSAGAFGAARAPSVPPVSGLRVPEAPSMSTRLGMGPLPAFRPSAPNLVAPAPAASTGSTAPRPLWIAIGALIAIAVGVGVALLAVGT